MMRSDSEPWFTPMRRAVWFCLHMSSRGTNRSSILRNSAAYSASVYSSFLNVRAGST